MKKAVIALFLFGVMSCSVKTAHLGPEIYGFDKIDAGNENCIKIKYINTVVPLFYKGYEDEMPLFSFNPTSFETTECLSKQEVSISIFVAKRESFPGGLGDWREVVYLSALVENTGLKLTATGESDSYRVFPVPGDRNRAVAQAVMRALENLNKKLRTNTR